MMRFERMGVPTAHGHKSPYTITGQYSGDDNGNSNLRRIAYDHISYHRTQAISGTAGIMYFYNEVIKREPRYTGERLGFAREDVAGWSPYDQAKFGLGIYGPGHRLDGTLSEEERKPTPHDPTRFGSMDTGDRADVFSVTGTSYADALRNFNTLANDKENGGVFGSSYITENAKFGNMFNPEVYAFGDGLPLIPPTEELVVEMLQATQRGRYEILGKMPLRSGRITVEKAAINAVMAGAKPEHFPAVLAAMEIYANDIDNGKMMRHAMSTGGLYALMMVLSGPIVNDLNMKLDVGVSSGAGNEANTVIGRAVRMCIRNIGHNRNPNIDTTGRIGKQNDHTLTVIAENINALPQGWKTHSEMMGFPANASTITMVEYGQNFSWRRIANQPMAHTLSDTLRDLRRVGSVAAQPQFYVFPPAMADALVDIGFTTKELVKEWLAGANPTTPDGRLILPVPPDAGTARNRHLVWPIVAGTDPGYAQVYSCNQVGINNYQTQLIETPGGLTAPSEPQNFNVAFSNGKRTATLTWSAPARTGGAPVAWYQVSSSNGINDHRPNGAPAGIEHTTWLTTWVNAPTSNQGMNWISLPATATTYTFTDLDPNAQMFFTVRAVNNIRNSAEVTPGLTTQQGIGGYAPDDFNRRANGVGAWAMFVEPPKQLEGPVKWGDRWPMYPAHSTLTLSATGGTAEARTIRAASMDSFGSPAAIVPIQTIKDGNGIVTGNLIANVRTALGGTTGAQAQSNALTYTMNWTTHPVQNAHLKATVTATGGGNTANAYLLGTIGNNTFEMITSGYLGAQGGSPPQQLASLNTLTFFATQPGTYTITLELWDVARDNRWAVERNDMVTTVTQVITVVP